MSQNKLAKLRNSDVFKACMRVLEDFRVPKEDYDVLDKRPHPHLTVRYCGIERVMTIPCTPKTKGRAPTVYSGKLRSMLKEMQMESLGGSSGGLMEHSMKEDTVLPLFVVNSDQPALSDDAFYFEGKRVRVVVRSGEPWFVASDVAAVLEVGRTDDAVRRLDEDEKGTDTIRTPGGAQKMVVINESGLYSLILTSRKEAAKRFKKWVTSEVLPLIRKTGSYAPEPVAVPTTAEAFAHAFTMIAESERRHAETERRQAEQAHQISYLVEKVERVETAQTVMRARPAGSESITHIRERIGRLHGLSSSVIDEVIRQSPYSPKPAGMVRNDHVDADGALYAVYWQKDITATFARFVAEATQVSAQLFTHPFIFGRFRIGSRIVDDKAGK